jgi:hypothetical protein
MLPACSCLLLLCKLSASPCVICCLLLQLPLVFTASPLEANGICESPPDDATSFVTDMGNILIDDTLGLLNAVTAGAENSGADIGSNVVRQPAMLFPEAVQDLDFTTASGGAGRCAF